MNTTSIQALFVGATLLASATPAAATEDLSRRIGVSVGHYIAAQGNLALQRLRENLLAELADTIAPITPQRLHADGEARAPVAAHASARASQ